jgi:hypothetical protein
MVGNCRGQMKIQQMAFMILAVFFFFILVGLFVLNIGLKDMRKSASDLQEEATISSIEVISNMPELNCESGKTLCLDRDKLRIMSGDLGKDYEFFWPVASLKVYQIYPSFAEPVKCPALNCNYYEVWDNGQSNVREYSTFVSICERRNEKRFPYDKCELGKLVVGKIINE